MKTLVTLTRASLAMGMTLLLSAGAAQAQVETVFWDNPDPYVGLPDGEDGNLPMTLVDATTITGQTGIADGRDMIGQVIFDGSQQFANFNRLFTFGTGEGEFDPALVGTKFQFSVDYYIPTAGGFEGDDITYLQISTNGVNTLDGNSAGFIKNTVETAGIWNTMTLDYTVTDMSPTTDIRALILAVDGGFGGVPNGDGVTPSIYFDNVSLTGGLPDAILGDFDGNGLVELADLDQFSGNIGKTIADNAELAALDLDDNGTIEAADLIQHYTTLVGTSNGQTGTFAGDANLDGVVDVLGDAAALINNLGVTATSWSQGDFNADTAVDVLSDAAALINNLGNSNAPAAAPATAAVPEPGSLSLLALAGLGAIVRRRR